MLSVYTEFFFIWNPFKANKDIYIDEKMLLGIYAEKLFEKYPFSWKKGMVNRKLFRIDTWILFWTQNNRDFSLKGIQNPTFFRIDTQP